MFVDGILSPWYLPPLALPTVYSDALSYDDEIRRLIKRTNELTELIQKLGDDLESIVDSSVSTAIQKFRTEFENQIIGLSETINQLQTVVDTNKTNTDKQILDLTHKIDKIVIDLNGEINNLYIELNTKIDTVESELRSDILDKFNKLVLYADNVLILSKNYTNLVSDEINKRIDDLIFELPDVYNPFTGSRQPLQTVLFDYYKNFRYFGLTADCYDALELTADQYDDLGLTAFEYDIYGSWILHEKESHQFDPMTGEWKSTRDLVNQLYLMLNYNGKTATEYDGIGFTVDEFDNSDYNAFQQDHRKYYKSIEPNYYDSFVNEIRLAWENPDPTNEQGTVDADMGDIDFPDKYRIVYSVGNPENMKYVDYDCAKTDQAIEIQATGFDGYQSYSRTILFATSSGSLVATISDEMNGNNSGLVIQKIFIVTNNYVVK